MRTLKWLLLVVLLALLAAFTAVWTGMYDVAADVPHRESTRAVLEYARERSIARRAVELTVPRLDDPALIATGAEHYAAMCTGCHLAPGLPETELRQGLNPQPPDLTRAGVARDPQRSFWIIKHGLKMTGMPAWGATHDDASIWGLVAFVQQLPELSPQAYAELTGPPSAGPGEETSPAPHDHDSHDHSTHRH